MTLIFQAPSPHINFVFHFQLVELLGIFAESVKINEKEDSCISEALPEIK